MGFDPKMSHESRVPALARKKSELRPVARLDLVDIALAASAQGRRDRGQRQDERQRGILERHGAIAAIPRGRPLRFSIDQQRDPADLLGNRKAADTSAAAWPSMVRSLPITDSARSARAATAAACSAARAAPP